jgi:hypothetical protein
MAEVVLDAMDTLFQLGVPSRNQVRVFRQERFYEIIEDFPGKQIMSTFLREAPECNYQWDTENLSLLSSRTLLCAIDKEMECTRHLPFNNELTLITSQWSHSLGA